jgi:hypothetical protein
MVSGPRAPGDELQCSAFRRGQGLRGRPNHVPNGRDRGSRCASSLSLARPSMMARTARTADADRLPGRLVAEVHEKDRLQDTGRLCHVVCRPRSRTLRWYERTTSRSLLRIEAHGQFSGPDEVAEHHRELPAFRLSRDATVGFSDLGTNDMSGWGSRTGGFRNDRQNVLSASMGAPQPGQPASEVSTLSAEIAHRCDSPCDTGRSS